MINLKLNIKIIKLINYYLYNVIILVYYGKIDYYWS